MRRIVFYSWQSDLPNVANRGFIQAALETTTEKIAADKSVAVDPVVDRDTQNVPGSPDIASTIFSKITGADVFVADVSIVTRAPDMRPTPNPNVLIELGYAFKSLGHERVVLVFNKSFGKLEELPFDLRTRRMLIYEMPENAVGRATERLKLEAQLDIALRSALAVVSSMQASEIPLPAVNAIENMTPNRRIVLRRTLEELLKKLVKLEPRKHSDGGTVEELITGINGTQEVVAEFSKISEAVAVLNDVDSALEIYRWFGKMFEKYNLPDGHSGRYSEADQDYFKFLGHELFITFFALLIRERRWETITRLLKEPIPIYIPNSGPKNVDWGYASKHLTLLLEEGHRRRRISLHGDILKDRHAQGGGLSAILTLQDMMDADFFLFLLSETLVDHTGFGIHFWRAWSCLNLTRAPMFILNSEQKKYAEEVVSALGLADMGAYKKVLSDRGPELAELFSRGLWDYPIKKTDIDKIGTR